jgi:ubiquitin-conjugating enzyme E2 T
MARELELLSSAPPPGVAAWPSEDGVSGAGGSAGPRLDVLDAEIVGAPETPYAGGVFRLRVTIPPEYPLKPPGVRFVTKIYHPNIDTQGRICLDTLNMPPKGAWKPSLNVATVLASVQLLISHPNPDDGLMADITDEFKQFPAQFHATALDWTARYAREPALRASSHAENPVQATSPKEQVRSGEESPLALSPATFREVPEPGPQSPGMPKRRLECTPPPAVSTAPSAPLHDYPRGATSKVANKPSPLSDVRLDGGVPPPGSVAQRLDEGDVYGNGDAVECADGDDSRIDDDDDDDCVVRRRSSRVKRKCVSNGRGRLPCSGDDEAVIVLDDDTDADAGGKRTKSSDSRTHEPVSKPMSRLKRRRQ